MCEIRELPQRATGDSSAPFKRKAKFAWDVNIGDQIILPDRPRTWQTVEEVEIDKTRYYPVMIDTDRCRWFCEIDRVLSTRRLA